MKPSWYNDARYYERMLAGVTTLLVEQGVVSLEDLFPWFVFHFETPEARFSPGDTVRPNFEHIRPSNVASIAMPSNSRRRMSMAIPPRRCSSNLLRATWRPQ